MVRSDEPLVVRKCRVGGLILPVSVVLSQELKAVDS